MSAVVTVAPLPAELLNSDDFMVSLVLDGIVKTHDSLVELGGTYEKVRAAESEGESALEESDSPEAQAFRQREALANAAIDAINQEAKERKDKIRKQLATERNETLTILTGQAIEGIDLETLQETYVTRLAGLKKLLGNVKDAVPSVVEYTKSLPSATRQAVGNVAAGDRSDRGWTPRFSVVRVDGNDVEPTTLGAAAKALGVSASVGRAAIMAQLIADTVTPDGLRTDSEKPHTLTVTVNSEPHEVVLVGKPASVKTEA